MRTAFAYAAIVATSSALDAKAIPDWVAGFVYGLTGNNHLSEIEQCYTGGQGVVDDAKEALNDIRSGQYIHGAEAIGQVINEFPNALSNCENMDDDINKIENWAKIFTEPLTLAKTASKNWLLHHKVIKEDIAKEEADWGSEKYFQAGIDSAMAVTEVVGPIAPSNVVAENFDIQLHFKIKDALSFVGGLLVGLTGDSHFRDFTQCEVDVGIIYKEV